MAIESILGASAPPALSVRRPEPTASESIKANTVHSPAPPQPTPEPEVAAEFLAENSPGTLPEPQLQPPRLRIQFDPAARRYVYQSVESSTGEVVQQLPTEEALRRLSYLRAQAKTSIDRSI